MTEIPNVADFRVLIDCCQSLSLASWSEHAKAEISYAPFLAFENGFYIFVSQLARHTGNMLGTGQASIMFIEPEAAAANPFARQRAIFDCAVEEIDQQQPYYEKILDLFQHRHGETVGILRALPDFHLLVLRPTRGQFVAGFGKAFTINVENGGLMPLSR